MLCQVYLYFLCLCYLTSFQKKSILFSTSENYGGAAAHLRFQVEIWLLHALFSFVYGFGDGGSHNYPCFSSSRFIRKDHYKSKQYSDFSSENR